MNEESPMTAQQQKRRELSVFVFLALVLAPVLTVMFIAAFGFSVWMYQILTSAHGV